MSPLRSNDAKKYRDFHKLLRDIRGVERRRLFADTLGTIFVLKNGTVSSVDRLPASLLRFLETRARQVGRAKAQVLL